MKPVFLRATAIVLLSSCGLPALSVYAGQDASKEMRQSDAELNRVYQKALAATPDPDAQAKLVKAQRAWVAFRDAETELMEKDGLALDATSKQSHVTELNNHRTKELLAIIEFMQ